jgi:hypothetical protein
MAGARDGCAARTRLLVWIIVAMQLVALHGAAASSLLCRYVANALKLQPRPMRAARAAGAARHGPVVFTHTHTHIPQARPGIFAFAGRIQAGDGKVAQQACAATGAQDVSEADG